MKLLPVLIALLLQPSSCARPTPPPEPPPKPAPPVPAEAGVPARSSCQRACDHMLAMGCVEPTTPGGRTCEDVFCPVSAGWDYACMALAQTCQDLDRCSY